MLWLKNVGRSKKIKKQPRPERCKHDNHDVLDNILKMKKKMSMENQNDDTTKKINKISQILK